MQKGLLITCPEYDDGTAYLTYFSRLIIEEALNKSIKTKKIKDENLNAKDFSEIMEKLDYRLVVFNGHGLPDSIYGYKGNIIVKLGQNGMCIAK